MKITELAGKRVVSTGELCKYMGVTMTSDAIERLGIKPEVTTAVGIYWRVNDVPRICMLVSKMLFNKCVDELVKE